MVLDAPAPRHKLFISYHHAGDQRYKDEFVRTYLDEFDDYSVREGDIQSGILTEMVRQLIRDEYIRGATVTVVLIGQQTWKRKHVDWEIRASLRDTRSNDRNGLLGILLPTYSALQGVAQRQTSPGRAVYTPNNIPPLLWDNVAEPLRFAQIRPWPRDAAELRLWIHEAFQRRNLAPAPTLARNAFADNRAIDQIYWSPVVQS
jgi:hypothetical protein